MYTIYEGITDKCRVIWAIGVGVVGVVGVVADVGE